MAEALSFMRDIVKTGSLFEVLYVKLSTEFGAGESESDFPPPRLRCLRGCFFDALVDGAQLSTSWKDYER